MPPRGYKAKQAAKAVAKGAAGGQPGQPPEAAGCQPEDEKVYAINSAHYARVQEALNIIQTTPGMDGVDTALPLDEGAVMQPLDEQALVTNITAGSQYVCGAPLSFAKPLADASPGVPIDTSKVETYMEHHFMDVDSITLPQIVIGCDPAGKDMMRTSPSEPVHALIFAASAALAEATADSQHSPMEAGRTISKWKKLLRSLPTTVKIVAGESARFFASVQARIDATVDAAVVGRQPVQWAAEIVLHRDRMWRLIGGRQPPGAEKVALDINANLNFKGLKAQTAGSVFAESVSKFFVDNCITVHERLVAHPDLVSLVLKYPNVWSTMNKLHGLIYKGGSKDNIQWTLETLDDMLSSGLIDAEDLSKRALIGHKDGNKEEKGQVAFICAKRQCKDYLLQHAGTKFSSGWQPEALVKMHEVFGSVPKFRAAMLSLHWQRGLPKSAIRFTEILENVLASKLYDESLRAQVNNSRSPADFITNMTDLRKDLNDVQVMFDAEVEASKPPPARAPQLPPADSQNPQQTDGGKPGTGDEELSYLDKVVRKLFPKVPRAALTPFITTAERLVRRI